MEFDYPERHGFGLGVAPGVFAERQARLRAWLRGVERAEALVGGSWVRYGGLAYVANHVPAPGQEAVLQVPAEGPTTLYAEGCRDDLVVADEVRPLPACPMRGDAAGVAAWLDAERAVKDDAEIDLLDEAATVASVGVEAAVSLTLPEATERHVAAAGVSAALRAGADECRCAVRSGPLAARDARWPDAGDRVLGAGEPVLVDLSGSCQGFRFRLVHTVAAGDSPRLHPAAHAGTAAALEACLGALRAGVSPRALAERARAAVRAAGETLEGDDLGHGIGLDAVEEPHLGAEAEAPVPAGAVLLLSVRVGLVRQARMVAVRATGPQPLGRLFAPGARV
jgi:Xaa-Pro aminopeptidase